MKKEMSNICIKGNMSQAPVAHACNHSYSEAEIRRIAVQSQPGQIVRTYLGKAHHNKGGVSLLSSSPSTTKKKKKKQCWRYHNN
jgi:hypothetical protein